MGEPAADERTPSRRTDVLLIAVLVLLTITVRWWHFATPSSVVPGTLGAPASAQASDPPSMDELWHVALSTGRGSPLQGYRAGTLVKDEPSGLLLNDAPPFWKVWTTLDAVTHPPLYLQTLRLWRSAFGESNAVAIAYSIFWSCVCVTFVYGAASTLFGRSAAIWSGAILALAPSQVYLGLEIRAYSMLAALSAVLLLVVIRIQRSGATRGNCVAVGALLLSMMLTHYHAIGVCLIAGAMSLAWAGRGKRWRVIVAGLVAAGAFGAVWLPFAIRQLPLIGVDTTFLDYRGPASHILMLGLLLPVRLMTEAVGNAQVAMLVSTTVLIASLVVARRRANLRPVAIWLAAGCVWMIGLDLIQHTRAVGLIRYSSALTPAAVMVLPGLCVTAFRKGKLAVHAGGAIGIALGLIGGNAVIRNDSPVFYPFAQTIAPRLEPGDVLIIHDARKSFFPWGITLDMMNVPGVFPRDLVLLDEKVSPDLRLQLIGRTAWYIELSADSDPQRVLGGVSVVESVDIRLTDESGMGRVRRAYRVRI